jgi:hypothetical protein
MTKVSLNKHFTVMRHEILTTYLQGHVRRWSKTVAPKRNADILKGFFYVLSKLARQLMVMSL